jgi:RNA-binding protein YhbY
LNHNIFILHIIINKTSMGGLTAMIASSYVHALEGRLRIKIPAAKGNDSKAREIESHLRHFAGVDSVSANPTTGNVLILYNSRLTRQERLISSLKESGYLYQTSQGDGEAAIASLAPHGVVEKVTNTVAATIMEVALSRLVSALI